MIILNEMNLERFTAIKRMMNDPSATEGERRNARKKYEKFRHQFEPESNEQPPRPEAPKTNSQPVQTPKTNNQPLRLEAPKTNSQPVQTPKTNSQPVQTPNTNRPPRRKTRLFDSKPPKIAPNPKPNDSWLSKNKGKVALGVGVGTAAAYGIHKYRQNKKKKEEEARRQAELASQKKTGIKRFFFK